MSALCGLAAQASETNSYQQLPGMPYNWPLLIGVIAGIGALIIINQKELKIKEKEKEKKRKSAIEAMEQYKTRQEEERILREHYPSLTKKGYWKRLK